MMSDYADNDYAMALGKEVAIADVDKELRLLDLEKHVIVRKPIIDKITPELKKFVDHLFPGTPAIG